LTKAFYLAIIEAVQNEVASGDPHSGVDNLGQEVFMSDLKNFLRIVAVTDRVSEDEQKRLIAMSKDKAIEGVSVDEQRSRVRVNCEVLVSGQIKPVYQMDHVNWFKISCSETDSEKCPRIGVISDVGTLFPTPLDDYRSVVSFRNGTVVRAFANRRLLADYVAVRKQGQDYFLVIDPRLDISVPSYVDENGLAGFLKDKVPADVLGLACELLKKVGKAVNPAWVKGLQSFKDERPGRRSKPDRKEDRQHRPRPESRSDPVFKQGMTSEDAAVLED